MLNFRPYLSVPKSHHLEIVTYQAIYDPMLAGSSLSSTSAVLATRFLILQRSMMSTAN